MSKFLDIVIAKEYTIKNNGQTEMKTSWNRVGKAWLTASGENLNCEFFHQPNTRFVIQFQQKNHNKNINPQNIQSETVPF